MKKNLTFCVCMLIMAVTRSQTLQSVTNSGNTTTNAIAVSNNMRLDASSVAYSEGLSINLPTDAGSYGGVAFHNTTRDGAFGSGTIKWGMYYNYMPEFGIGTGALSFVRTNSTSSLVLFPSGSSAIGGTGQLSSGAWKGASAIGADSYDKVVIGGLTSGYTGATVGGHNSALNAWVPLNLSGSELVLRTNGEVEHMRINSSGNVGIGTTNPQGYKLAVAGNMIAESVKVKLQGNWPDYVFSKDHQLRSLGDLEKYIQTNKHLPEIPSAEEVKKDGIELGEMNVKLLKKIEELTLYMIEKDRQVSLLEQRLKKLENKK